MDPAPRAGAQSLIAEMHSGFEALRSHCEMSHRTAWEGFVPPPEVITDLARIEDLWSRALERSGGPWHYGDFTLADAFHAPVATRTATYSLPVAASARVYVAAMLAVPISAAGAPWARPRVPTCRNTRSRSAASPSRRRPASPPALSRQERPRTRPAPIPGGP